MKENILGKSGNKEIIFEPTGCSRSTVLTALPFALILIFYVRYYGMNWYCSVVRIHDDIKSFTHKCFRLLLLLQSSLRCPWA